MQNPQRRKVLEIIYEDDVVCTYEEDEEEDEEEEKEEDETFIIDEYGYKIRDVPYEPYIDKTLVKHPLKKWYNSIH